MVVPAKVFLLVILGVLAPCLASVIPAAPSEGSGFCLSSNSACVIEKEQEWARSNLLAEYNLTNFVGCSERCSLVPDCTAWTWWEHTERCQIFSSCVRNVTNCTNCQSGPRSCGIWEQYVTAVSGGQGGHDMVYMVGSSGMCANDLTMPSARWGHSSAFIQSKLILCGGTQGPSVNVMPSNTCDIYNMASRKWENGTALSTARHGAAGLQLLGKMYMIGGSTEGGPTESMEVYDPSKDRWTPGPNLPLEVTAACAVAYRDSIIVSGGTTAAGNESARVFKFNVTQQKWEETTPMKQARAGHGCSRNEPNETKPGAPTPEVIVTGGEFQGKALASVEAFNLVTAVWRDLESLPYNLQSQGQSDLGQPAVLGGLLTGEPSPLVLVYKANKWKYTRWWLPTNLAHHSVTLYPRDLVTC